MTTCSLSRKVKRMMKAVEMRIRRRAAKKKERAVTLTALRSKRR